MKSIAFVSKLGDEVKSFIILFYILAINVVIVSVIVRIRCLKAFPSVR